MTIEKPEDFYQFYTGFKRYRTPSIKPKQIRWYDREFWIPAHCTRDMSVLELGSGPGEFLLYLQRKDVRRFVGVEMDRDAIAAMPVGLEAHIQTGDIWGYLDRPDDAQRWDRIVLLDVLEHFSVPEGFRLLEKLKSILAPGGMVVARVPNMGSPWGGMYQYADVTHKASYNAHSLGQLGGAAGYDIVTFVAQKRGSPVRRILEDILHATLARMLTVYPAIWTPNIIVVWRLRD